MICFAPLDSPPTTAITKKPGYHITQKAYDLALNVPQQIADDDDVDPKVRLTAAKEIRAVIDHAHELELIALQRKALENNDNTTNAVIVREDETFFDNKAHEQAQQSHHEGSSCEEEQYPRPDPADPTS
ncbi:hypothetical protein C5Y96_10715 [Blastopirellula marina]|uniref:Uncharacterized protein n=1 Tax=Blastopirellula marina TaxID=124 RepID=A0A2S8FMC1_9BACT|nr:MULTISPECIES: hypothetical protein [Pirellulaceae]PQO33315.1 hypothetical protein C5Y96_10715 [Blastopirellula marina]RCS52404.1 hypothetical protein DTL36_10725 [Bremerella cremea]